MHSMTQEDTLVVGGVDAHADTHHAAALDERGALLATKSFPTTTPGYRRVAGLAERLRRGRRRRGRVDRLICRWRSCAICASTTFGSSRSTSRTRTRAAVSARATRSTPRWPPGCSWPARRTRSRSRPTGSSSRSGCCASPRDSAVKSRSAAIVQLGDLIITAPQELRDQLSAPQDDPRQGRPLPPAATIDRRAAPTHARRKVRAALDRRTDRRSRR